MQRIIYAAHFEHSGRELFGTAKKMELEGIEAKDGASAYTTAPD